MDSLFLMLLSRTTGPSPSQAFAARICAILALVPSTTAVSSKTLVTLGWAATASAHLLKLGACSLIDSTKPEGYTPCLDNTRRRITNDPVKTCPVSQHPPREKHTENKGETNLSQSQLLLPPKEGRRVPQPWLDLAHQRGHGAVDDGLDLVVARRREELEERHLELCDEGIDKEVDAGALQGGVWVRRRGDQV